MPTYLHYAVGWLVFLSAGQFSAAQRPGPERVDASGDPLPAGAVARLGTVRLHQSNVEQMSFAPNGKTIAVFGHGRSDGVVRLWDVATGKQLQRWTVTGTIRSSPANTPFAFSRDSRYLAFAWDKAMHVWDTVTGEEVLTKTQDYIEAVAFTPDGRALATLSRSGARMYEFPSGNVLHVLAITTSWGQLAFSADGKTLVTVGHDPANRKVLRVHRWNSASGQLQDTCAIEFENFTPRLSPDGQTLLGPDRRAVPGPIEPVGLRRWDTATGKVLAPPEGQGDYPVNIAFDASVKLFTAVSRDGHFRVWEQATGKLLHQLNTKISPRHAWSLGLAADGKLVAVMGRQDDAVHLFELATGKELHASVGHGRGPLEFAFTADGRFVLSANRGGAIQSHPVKMPGRYGAGITATARNSTPGSIHWRRKPGLPSSPRWLARGHGRQQPRSGADIPYRHRSGAAVVAIVGRENHDQVQRYEQGISDPWPVQARVFPGRQDAGPHDQ
jgi:WD40 repeat protein